MAVDKALHAIGRGKLQQLNKAAGRLQLRIKQTRDPQNIAGKTQMNAV